MKKKITDEEILKVFLRKDGNIDSNKLKEKFINENQEYFIYLNNRYKNSLGYSYKEIINAIKNNVENLDLRHFEQKHKLTDEDIKLIFNNFIKFNKKTIKNLIENDYNLENYLLNRYKNNPFDKNRDNKYNYIFKVVKLIQNNYDEWPVCSCGKILNNINKKHCSKKCGANDPITKNKIVETCLILYGVTNGGASRQAHEKIEETLKEHYGKDVKSPFAIKEVRDKSKETLMKNYGVDHNWKIEGSYKKKQQTWLSTIGVINPYCQEKCHEKSRQTTKNNSKEIYEKKLKSYKESTGFDSWHDNPDFISKRKQKYTYKGINFDSSDELAFYIYYKDKGFNIKSNTKRFIYYFKNIECRYIPDFEIEGKIYEIKGEHFLDKETGKWINPFRDPKWTDKEYQESCDKYEAKHQCALSNNVEIIYDCKEYKKYVENIYGRGFIETCKKKK